MDADLADMKDADVGVTPVLDLTSRTVTMFNFALAHGAASSRPGSDLVHGGGSGDGGSSGGAAGGEKRIITTPYGISSGFGPGEEGGGRGGTEGEGPTGGVLHEARVRLTAEQREALKGTTTDRTKMLADLLKKYKEDTGSDIPASLLADTELTNLVRSMSTAAIYTLSSATERQDVRVGKALAFWGVEYVWLA